MLGDIASAAVASVGWIGLFAGMLGLAYCTASLIAFHRFFRAAARPVETSTEAVTLLKPLCGDEPNLADNLKTFVEQDHAGPIQIVCGYADPDDRAVVAVEALRASVPTADITAVVSTIKYGPNAKVSNLVNMDDAASHDIVILSDSDMSVGRDYLARVLAALSGDGVGAVSLLYRGRGDGGFWSTLAATGISYHFLPNAVFGVWSSLATPCMGSTIALRRGVLEGIGGFRSFAHHLADDYAIGEAVRRAGLKVDVPPMVVTHACAEKSFAELWRHEVRWGATVRGVVPKSYAGSVIAYPLPLLVVGMLATQRYDIGGILIATTLIVRVLQALLVDRQVGAKAGPLWLLPFRDSLSFAVFVASFFARRVDWRGTRHQLRTGGLLAVDQEHLA